MSDEAVSRETVSPPPAPETARGVFAAQLPLAVAYVELLATEAIVRGLIGPREVPRLWERHLLNCALVTDLVPEAASVGDVGSGAGLPGIVMAIRRPDLEITLVEPLLRRTVFLELAVERLGLAQVSVVRARAEDVEAGSFEVVTSRAVAPLDRLVGWSAPLIAPGGRMLAMKGASAEDEIASSRTPWERRGLSRPRVHRLGEGLVDPQVTVVEVRRH